MRYRCLVIAGLFVLVSCAFADNGFEQVKLFPGRDVSVAALIARLKHDRAIPDGGRVAGAPFVPAIKVDPSLFFCEGLGSDVYFIRQTYAADASSPPMGIGIENLPSGIHSFSFREKNFSPPSFSLNETATPCLLFNDKGQACIFSPASNFMTSRLVGDGQSAVAIAFNPGAKIAASQDALLIFAPTIHEAWEKWGQALRSLYKRKPAEDSQDILLQKFGYWTDNGADYYYNYDLDRGYANTLLDLRKRYQDEGIPLGYVQLDSWWYEKSTTDATGKFSGAIKNKNLPARMWNRYGGLMEYKADPFLFPTGLQAFDKDLGLPLATHNRWMDVASPYRDRFKISGVAAIDPGFWNEIATYLSSNGVKCYEQDWLDRIYDNSPEMTSDESVGDAFTGGMAKACQAHGLTMQYCMATPRFMMQGVKYPNLTTIRTSDDRFGPDRWRDFIYVSELANAVGARPWCDVFKSSETANMILAVLSGGPVGTGDLMGKEDKANIMKAVRSDGVIVRPDTPLLPTDRTFLNEANGVDAPFVAETETRFQDAPTAYYFAFLGSQKSHQAILDLPRYSNTTHYYYLYNMLTKHGDFYPAGSEPTVQLGPDGYGYWMAAPVYKQFIFLGDPDKFAPMGSQRIENIRVAGNSIRIRVRFAKGEGSVKLVGLMKPQPRIGTRGMATKLTSYDPNTGNYVVEVTPKVGQTEGQLELFWGSTTRGTPVKRVHRDVPNPNR